MLRLYHVFPYDAQKSWPINPSTQLPNGVTLDSAGYVYQMAPGTQLGVYQKLSTVAGGEVVSSDSY